MTVDTDRKYQEKVSADVNMLFRLKQKDHLNKGHGKMTIPDVEEVQHVFI